MVGPLGIGLGILGGTAAGALGGWLLGGGTKKEQVIAQAQEQQMGIHIEPLGIYTPTYAPSVVQQLDYVVQIESPGAQVTTKKEATQTPTFTITPTIAPVQQAGQEATQTQFDSSMFILLAVLGVGGAVAYTIFKKKGGKHK